MWRGWEGGEIGRSGIRSGDSWMEREEGGGGLMGM